VRRCDEIGWKTEAGRARAHKANSDHKAWAQEWDELWTGIDAELRQANLIVDSAAAFAPIADPAAVESPAANPDGISQWRPPPAYVGTKTIQNSPLYKKGGEYPAGSTIDRWKERSRKHGQPVIVVTAAEFDSTIQQEGDNAIIAVRAPDTGEVYYPAQWVSDAWTRWAPRPTNCES
jgi:hypothetical protein